MTCLPVKTKYGTFHIKSSENGIQELVFPDRNKGKTNTSKKDSKKSLQHAQKAGSLLKDYFLGRKVSFKGLKFDLSNQTAFQRSVLEELAKVPSGETHTYGDLAKRVGSPRAARAVGSVMNQNQIPILLPCHRIVGSDGKLVGYAKGLAWKRRLLALESSKDAF